MIIYDKDSKPVFQASATEESEMDDNIKIKLEKGVYHYDKIFTFDEKMNSNYFELEIELD